jgi:WD40 repeat protein
VGLRATVLAVAAAVVVAVVAIQPEPAPDPAPRESTAGGHENLVEALALAPNRDVLISSGWDHTVRFWNLGPEEAGWGEEILKLPHGSQPYAVAPSPDGRYLAVGGSGDLTVWKSGVEGWSPMATKPGADGRYLAFAPDSRTLAVGGKGGAVRILAVPSLEAEVVLRGLPDMVHAVAFSPDGSLVAASSFGGELAIWDAKTGARSPRDRNAGRVHCFAFSQDGRTMATASWLADGGGVTLWNLKTGEHRAVLGVGQAYNAVAFSPDGCMVAAAGVDRTIKLFHPETGESMGELTGDLGWVKTILFTDGGTRLAYGGRDGAIRFLDVPVCAPG